MLDLTVICDIYAAMQVAESRYFHDDFIEKLDRFLDKIALRAEKHEYFVKVLKFDDKLRSKVLALLEGFLNNRSVITSEKHRGQIRRLIFSIED